MNGADTFDMMRNGWCVVVTCKEIYADNESRKKAQVAMLWTIVCRHNTLTLNVYVCPLMRASVGVIGPPLKRSVQAEVRYGIGSNE